MERYPTGHGLQVDALEAPGVDEYMPMLQLKQLVDALDTEYLPLGQAWQAEMSAAPTSAENVPGVQEMQYVLAPKTLDAYVPTGQEPQPEDPAEGEKVPGVHAVHLVEAYAAE